jgi:hypothetical protein
MEIVLTDERNNHADTSAASVTRRAIPLQYFPSDRHERLLTILST